MSMIDHVKALAESEFGGDVGKAFGAPADAQPGGQTVTRRPSGLQVQHDPTPHTPAPVRKLACAACGHAFTVTEGEQALAQKRRLQAGLPAEPDALHKTLKETAAGTFGKARPW
jgi:hypothetical protein